MRKALLQISPGTGEEVMARFVKFLDKDRRGRVSYTDFQN